MKLVTKEQMQNIDKEAFHKYGIPSIVLMENAGAAVYQYIKNNIEDYQNKRFLIFCGGGNNGGDGAVVARKLFLNNIYTRVVVVSDLSEKTGDKKINFNIIQNLGVPIEFVFDEDKWEKTRRFLNNYDVIIDAIFGIGFHSNIENYIYSIIECINASKQSISKSSYIISLDIPSGVHSDGGVANISVMADTTITFGLPKISMVDFPAREFIGKRVVANINIPRELLKSRDIKNNLLTVKNIKKRYIKRKRNSHKANYGHLLSIGGTGNTKGALIIAGQSAMRAGAGLVTVTAENPAFPELMSLILPDDIKKTVTDLKKFIDKRNIDCILVGNGWNIGEIPQSIIEFLLDEDNPVDKLLFDADGLNNIASNNNLLKLLENTTKSVVLTPHIKEMARLIDRDVKYTKHFKREVANDFSEKYGVVTVLKDAISVIGLPNGQVWFNEFGSSSLAKAGSGDILAGIIAGLFASGYSKESASLIGSYILARAGEIYEKEVSIVSAIPSDIIKIIPKVFKEISN